jgi:hypothetical protein
MIPIGVAFGKFSVGASETGRPVFAADQAREEVPRPTSQPIPRPFPIFRGRGGTAPGGRVNLRSLKGE